MTGNRFADLREVVPWGRTFDEYAAMFGLTETELAGRILDCGGGPASFTAEGCTRGAEITACDPLYVHTSPAIEARFEEIVPDMLARTIADRDLFVWTFFSGPDANIEQRRLAMRRFVADLPAGVEAGRYVAAALPDLPFADRSFDLALSSHFLFLYSGQLSLDFHLAGMRELLRVAPEVRVFPIQDLAGRPSDHLAPVVAALEAGGHSCEIRRVDYEFQRGANEMLVATKGSCSRD